MDNIEEREEGGTPDIIGSMRAAFTFITKDHVSVNFIQERESKYLKYFMNETKSVSNLVMMGNTKCNRLPVISFLINHSQKRFGYQKIKYLHYNFIAALLNDLFGIIGRKAENVGMYTLNVLNINHNEIQHVLSQIRSNNNELARPGVFRINLHFTLNEKELEYIVNAVKYICENGWKFLPIYTVNPETGDFSRRKPQRKSHSDDNNQWRSLLDISFDNKNGKMVWNEKHLRVEGKALNENFDKFFSFADDILDNLDEYLPEESDFAIEDKINDEGAWYWLPSELFQDVVNIASNKFVE